MSNMWKSLKGMQCLSPPKTKKQSPTSAPVWPSLAGGLFPCDLVCYSSQSFWGKPDFSLSAALFLINAQDFSKLGSAFLIKYESRMVTDVGDSRSMTRSSTWPVTPVYIFGFGFLFYFFQLFLGIFQFFFGSFCLFFSLF